MNASDIIGGVAESTPRDRLSDIDAELRSFAVSISHEGDEIVIRTLKYSFNDVFTLLQRNRIYTRPNRTKLEFRITDELLDK